MFVIASQPESSEVVEENGEVEDDCDAREDAMVVESDPKVLLEEIEEVVVTEESIDEVEESLADDVLLDDDVVIGKLDDTLSAVEVEVLLDSMIVERASEDTDEEETSVVDEEERDGSAVELATESVDMELELVDVNVTPLGEVIIVGVASEEVVELIVLDPVASVEFIGKDEAVIIVPVTFIVTVDAVVTEAVVSIVLIAVD